MNVHHTVRKRRAEFRPEQSHETRQAHEFDLTLDKRTDKRSIECRPPVIGAMTDDESFDPGLGGATTRPLLRLIDGLFGYLVAFIAVLVSRKNQRLGDMAAHTLVVRK